MCFEVHELIMLMTIKSCRYLRLVQNRKNFLSLTEIYDMILHMLEQS